MVYLCFWFLVYAHGKVLYFWHEDATNERIMNREHIKENITNVIFRNEIIRLAEDIKKEKYYKFAFDELCIEIRRNIESTNSIMQSLNVFTNYVIDMQKLERRSIDDRRPSYLQTLTRIKEEFYNPSNLHTLTAANIKPFTEYRMSESFLAFLMVIIDDMIVSKIIEPYDIDTDVICNANNLQYLYNQQSNFEATAAVIMNEVAKNSVVDDHYLPLSIFMLDSKACTMKNIQKFFLRHISGFFSAGDILVFEKYDVKIITKLLGVVYPAYKSDELDCLADDNILNIVAKFLDAEVSDLVTYIKSLIHTFTTTNLMLYNCKETLFRQFHDLHQSKPQQYNLKKFQGYVRNIEGIGKLFDVLFDDEISQCNLDTSKVKQEASMKQ